MTVPTRWLAMVLLGGLGFLLGTAGGALAQVPTVPNPPQVTTGPSPLPPPTTVPATQPIFCGTPTPPQPIVPTTATTRLVTSTIPAFTGPTIFVPPAAGAPAEARGFTCLPGPDGILGTADDVLVPMRADTGAGGSAGGGSTSAPLLLGAGLAALLLAVGVRSKARRSRP